MVLIPISGSCQHVPMWLQLEKGVARHCRNRLHFDVGDPAPDEPARRALAMEAAHSVLPECAMENLPVMARLELDSGLTGPLREAVAGAAPTEEAVGPLRDRLVESLSGQPGHVGALVLSDHIHLGWSARRYPPLSRSSASTGTTPTGTMTIRTRLRSPRCSAWRTRGGETRRSADAWSGRC